VQNKDRLGTSPNEENGDSQKLNISPPAKAGSARSVVKFFFFHLSLVFILRLFLGTGIFFWWKFW